MARQLDILALEPFYGGVRKQTLDLLSRHSRHRWSIFKLPARRLERRLNTAAQWFSSQIARAPKFRCDVLFTSDAMNLAEFLRLNPSIGHKPSITYFYCNQLAGQVGSDQQARIAMLSTASSATEIWFNSFFHMKSFLAHAASVYDAHKELGGREPLRAMVAKSQLMHPPVEIAPPGKDANVVDAERKSRTLFLDNREGAASEIFSKLLADVVARKETASIHVFGRKLEAIPESIPTVHIEAHDEAGLIRSLRRCELYVSAFPPDQFEPMAMRAMAMGCIPILRKEGYYAEFLPTALHTWCLYNGTAAELLSKVMDLWYLRRPAVARRDLDTIFDRYSPINATRNFDDRLDELSSEHEI